MGFALEEIEEELNSFVNNDASEHDDDMYEPSDIPEDIWDEDSEDEEDDPYEDWEEDDPDEEWEEEDF